MKSAFLRVASVLGVLALVVGAGSPVAAQCVSLTGTTYTQNFDTLSNTAGSTTNNLTITGWFMTESGGGARDNEQYAVDTGGSTTGDTYSYGAAGSTERALGALRSGTLIPIFGACFTNNTGSTISSLQVGYTGEEWRLGTAARTDQISFEYSLNATDLVTGTWTGVPALNFVTPDTATTGAKNGNAAAERTVLSSTIGALSIANGATFWIRWTDVDASGADDGLSVDDFSLALPNPNLTIDDVSQAEGNAGTSNFTFTVTLSAPAPTGGVTFDIATADNTATTADSDYVAKNLTSQTIAAGNTTYTFDVVVNGDSNIETNETFFVNVTNVTNAVVTDGQGQGTIQNDDSPPNLSINDVTSTEGNAGTKTFTFTVSLDAPALAGGVSFDIATADGTATLANSDYVSNSATGVTIAQGGTTATFDVTVNGDIAVEPDETFLVNVTNVTGATVVDAQGVGTIQNDDQAVTLIHDVQGSGAASPIAGSAVTIDGIVVGSFQGANGLGGFYVEEETGDQDADPATSEGIFVFNTATPVTTGDRVHVSGTVTEFNGLTEISPTTSVTIMSSGNALPAAATPPIPAPTSPAVDWERYEGMLVTFPGALYVTDTFSMAKFGEVGLSSGGRLLQPTNTVDPNDAVASGTTYVGPWTNSGAVTAAQTANTNNLITLDDGRNGTNLSPETYAPGGGAMRLGNTVTGLTGVMTYAFSLYMVEPTATPTFVVANPRTGPPSVGSPAIKVGFQNTLNFFVNVGTGRGAANSTEFTRQRDKLVAALSGLGADVIGLSELEKDPTALDGAKPDNAAAQSLAAGLTTATGHAWAATADPWSCETDGAGPPCNPGTDPDIKCGIVYDTTKVTPVGASFTDWVAAAGTYSRGPYAQVFTINSTGGKFAVVVNHLRSKGCSGSSGLDADQGDGQGCFNNRRMSQAVATSAFVSSASFTGVANVLLVGDMNAYGEEDPIDAFRANGFVDLIGADTSYNFNGQSGHIDHALASASLAPYVTGAGVWHINADEPVVTDYVTTGKPADAPYAADAYRSSDHDPVVVGIMGTVPVSLTSFSAD